MCKNLRQGSICKSMNDFLDEKEVEIKGIINNLSLTEIMGKNPAVVYDIDHTLLDGNGRALKQIVRTFSYAKEKGFKPFIVTARPDTQESIKITILQLFDAGIYDQSIYFLPQDRKNVKKYKMLARKNISQDHTVGISIGDTHWDFGEYGGIGVHIPWDDCNCTYDI